MSRHYIYIFIFLIVSSCKHKPATENEIKIAILNERFDKSIVLYLNQYEALKTYFEENSDTIINYNNKIPIHIINDLDQLRKSIGKDKIKSFNVNSDIIGIEFKTTENKNGLCISHTLIWSRKGKPSTYQQRDYRYIQQKDTILNNSCFYRIGLFDKNEPNKIYGPPIINL